MTDENVISFGTKRTLADEKTELRQAEEVHRKHLNAAALAHKANLLEQLGNIRKRVEADELDGLCIAGRNPENGAFLSTALLNVSATRVDTYLAYAGILGALQIDMTDLANNGPHMNSDGTYFALGAVEPILEDDE